MASRKDIVFFTNSELGQASVILAVAAEMATQLPGHIHLVSFKPLARSIPDSIKFHCLAGKSMKTMALERGIGFLPMHPPGLKGARKTLQEALPAVITPWEPESYLSIYEECCELLRTLKPALVVVDPIFGPALDACVVLEQLYVVLSPNTFKDHTTQEQAGAAGLWKYPCIASGYSFPLPIWLLLVHAYLAISFVLAVHTSTKVQELNKARNEHGIPGGPKLSFNDFRSDILYLLPSVPAIDFPLVVPTNVIGRGPIIMEHKPLEEVDPELAKWLARAPSIVINMGSHVAHEAHQADEIMQAVTAVLGRHESVQVLWKLQSPNPPDVPSSLEARLRILPWLPESPVAILSAAGSHATCYVHHGGSNSFHEAIAAGVPQIVCPVWLDTYDHATRVEYLGIGIWASRPTAPELQAGNLADALERVLLDFESNGPMRNKAQHLGAVAGGTDSGRRIAARRIMAVAEEVMERANDGIVN